MVPFREWCIGFQLANYQLMTDGNAVVSIKRLAVTVTYPGLRIEGTFTFCWLIAGTHEEAAGNE